VRLFGSFQTDLCTYLSDLDITIIQSGRAINNMKEVEHVLPQSSGMSSLPESESTSWFIDTKGENNNDSDNSKIKTSVSTSEIVDLTSQSRKANANDSIGEQSSHETSDVNTYYSDSGDSDIESEYSGDGSEDDMSINVIRNTKRLTDANSPHRASVTKLTATDIKNKAKKTLGQLDDLYRHLRRFGYVTKAEFRKRAKVPIISFTHMSGVVCDISLDVTNDTTDAVQSMLHQGKHPEAFRAVTYFLKAFLSQLGLDSPFNGGIGSFKLYAMVAHVLRRFPLSNTNSKCRTCPGCSIKYHSSDAGALLLSFLKYYSHETNVNINTEFVECGVTINFLSTRLIDKCRYYFKMAYNVLCTNDMQQHNTHKYSILWKILPNAHTFALDREMTYRTCCSHMSDYSEGRREEIAVSILNDMQRRLQTEYTNTTLSFDQIKVSDPCFAHQLMSHNSVRSAVGHLGHMNSTQPLAIKSKIKRDENRNNNNKVYKDDDDGFAVSAAIAAGARTKHNAKQQQLKRKLHQTEKNNSAKILRRENIAKPKANSGRVVEVGLTKKPQFKKLLKNNFPKWKKQKS
jgi:DNA polymerase sigma